MIVYNHVIDNLQRLLHPDRVIKPENILILLNGDLSTKNMKFELREYRSRRKRSIGKYYFENARTRLKA